jgi:hypothetical protein
VTGEEALTQEAIQPNVSLGSGAAITGRPVQLKWDVPPTKQGAERFLVIALPEAVRFGGDGFIALPPNDRAPRSIRSGQDRTRLIVPLSGPLANPKGSATIIFYESGSEQLSWNIVQIHSGTDNTCIEQSVSKGSIDSDVRLGQPHLLTQNRFSEGDPLEVYGSNRDRFLLLQFADRFQILNKKTGDLILDHDGTSAKFSPKGRYVSSNDASGRFQLLDVLAGKIVFKTSAVQEGDFGGATVAAWMNGDAILILGFGRNGGIELLAPMVDDRDLFSGYLGCNGCSAFGDSSLVIDFDQMVFAVAQHDEFIPAFSLLERPVATRYAASRPRHRIIGLKDISHVADNLELADDRKTSQGHFFWKFSDKIGVAFFDVQNGDIEKQKLLLSSRLADSIVLPRASVSGDAPQGKILQRRVEVAGVRLLQKNSLEEIEDALARFNVTLAAHSSGSSFRPIAYAQNGDDSNLTEVQNSALVILKRVASIGSKGRSPLPFRSEAALATKNATYLAYTYGNLSACQRDEGPPLKHPWTIDNKQEEPPVVSADRLIELWSFQLLDGQLFIAQQWEQCSPSALDGYGDLISIFVPTNSQRPIEFKRIAAAHNEGGSPLSVGGVSSDRLSLGTSLGLAQNSAPKLLVSMIGERFLTITSKDTGSAVVLDAPSMKRLQLLEGLVDSLDIKLVSLTSDFRNFVQVNEGGSLSFIRMSTRELILSGRFIDDEVVLFDNSLNYESTNEGASYVFVQIPGSSELYSLDQFSGRLASPGVARSILSGNAARPLPESGITPPSLRVEEHEDRYAILARSEAGLSRLRIVIDGVLFKEETLAGQSQTVILSKGGMPSGRWISFIVQDQQQLSSPFRAIPLGNKPYSGKLNVLTLGVDKFNGALFSGIQVNDLIFASTDAKRFEIAIKTHVSSSYSSYHSDVVVGGKINPGAFLSKLTQQVQATSDQDTLILFIATHGSTEGDEFSVIFPSERIGGEAEKLSFSSIVDLLKLAKGRVFVFLDACHSATATQDAASAQIAASNRDIVVISASKGRQSSLENSYWGGGIFTTAVIQAIASNGEISQTVTRSKVQSIEDLYADIRKIVISKTNGEQTPWFKRAIWQGAQSLN